MSIETLEKTMSTIHKVEKAICIPIALSTGMVAVGDFSCNHYFWGTTMVICTIYLVNMIRIYFVKQKSRVNIL